MIASRRWAFLQQLPIRISAMAMPSRTHQRQTSKASQMIIDCHAHLVPQLLDAIRTQALTFPRSA
jgi:hypothetical protein